MAIDFTVDAAGRPVARDGNFLCLKSSAYDTCMALGQDPAYADCTELPQKVVDFYDATGFDVIEWATLGWMRGRGFSMKDPWQKFVPPDRGRKRQGSRTTRTVTEDDLSRQRALQNGPDTWFTSASTSKGKGKGDDRLRRQITDVSGTMLTDAVIKDLSRELRAELREHLQPQQWQPVKRGTTKVCRTVGEVQRTCRTFGRLGNSTALDVLSRKLEQEVSRLTMAVTVHQAVSL